MNDELRAEVLQMFAADQAAVQAFVGDADRHREAFDRRHQTAVAPWPYCLLEWEPLSDAPSTAVDVVKTVAANIARLHEIVEEHGWPGRRQVGVEGADAAWTLLRHAGSGVPTIGTPAHLAFQRSCVPLLEDGVGTGDVHPRQFAAIVDSLRKIDRLAPKYAVQPDDYDVIDGQARFHDPVDLDEVERSRQSIGLPPLADDVRRRAAGERLYVSGPLRADPWPPLQ